MKQKKEKKVREFHKCAICGIRTRWYAIIKGVEVNYCFDHFNTVRK